MAITKIQSNAFPATIDLSNIDLTIGAGEILEANLANSSVTTAKIATDAITSDHVTDGAIAHSHLHTNMDLSGKTVTLPTLSQTFVVNGQIQSNVTGGGLYTSAAGGIPRLYLGGGSGFGFNRQSSSEDIFFGEPGDTGTWRVRGAGTISLGVGNSNTTVTVQGNGGGVGIGTTSPSQLLHINSATSNPTGIGLSNSERYYSVRSDNFSLVFRDETVGLERMRITSAGNVGIGTSSPENKLTIIKNTTAATENTYGVSVQSVSTSGYTELLLGASDAVDAGIIQTAAKNTNFTGKNLALQPQGGNVGIGTTSPLKKLHIESGNGAQISSPTGLEGSVIRLQNNQEWEAAYGTSGGDFLGGLEFASGDTSTGVGVRTAIKTTVDTYYNSNSLAFYTAPGFTAGIDERMRITSAGNVGIGTSSPNGKLQVTGGTSNASSLATAYSLAAVTIVPKATSGYSLAFGSGPGDLPYIQMSANGAASGNMLLQPYGGNVGIGTTSPSSALSIVGDSIPSQSLTISANSTSPVQISLVNGYGTREGLIFVGNGSVSNTSFGIISTQQALTFQTASYAIGSASDLSTGWTERMHIDSIGRVGIGTQSPSTYSKVHIKGSTGAIGSPGLLYCENLDDASALYIKNAGTAGTTYGYDRSVFEAYVGSSDVFKILNSGTIVQNGVATFTAGFSYLQNNGYYYWDIPVGDEGGHGNIIEVHAMYDHYFAGYGAGRFAFVGKRGTSTQTYDIWNYTTGNGGNFSISAPSAGILRIEKNAGTYPGTGYGHIMVRWRKF